MEMDSVIIGQRITQRKKPIRIVHAPVNSYFSPQNKAVRRTNPKQKRQSIHLDLQALKNGSADKDMRVRPAPRNGTPSFLLHLATPRRRIAATLAAFLIAAVIFVLIGAAGKYSWDHVNLAAFTMPEDLHIAEQLLLSLTTDGAEEEELPPSLPLTMNTSIYRIGKNETLDAIARRFGVRMDTLISLNAIKDARRIQSGATLKIPSIDGIMHTVSKGESLGGIAHLYKIDILDLVDANNLSSQIIQPGKSLFIPGARLASSQLKRALGTLTIWPITGRISSNYGYRLSPFSGIRQFHNGLDIVGPEDSTVRAAMDGKVAETGYSAIFGNFVILSHADGYQTLYGHLNKIAVKPGQALAQGSSVGLLGSTGMSTGPHVHFGVFKRGVAQDPRKILGK